MAKLIFLLIISTTIAACSAQNFYQRDGDKQDEVIKVAVISGVQKALVELADDIQEIKEEEQSNVQADDFELSRRGWWGDKWESFKEMWKPVTDPPGARGRSRVG